MKHDAQTNHYRLHHLPFLLMWVASFGVAWLTLFMAAMLWTDAKMNISFLQELSNWVYSNARWLDGVVMAAGLGALLALVQPWLMRWRYGFVPRFWRISSFFGAILSGSLFSEIIYNNGYYDLNGVWTQPDQIAPVIVWFGSLTAIQTLALWPVARRAWLYPLAGFGAAAVALLMGNLLGNYYGLSQTNALFFGSIAQAVFSGALFLYLMRDYRVEAVAKRDEKSKAVVRIGLHPISFIGLWAMAHLFGWVTVVAFSVIISTIRYSVPYMNELIYWAYSNPWVLYPAMGLTIGAVTAVAQPWLMQQRSGFRPRFWLRLSIPASAIAGLGLWRLFVYSYYSYDAFGSYIDETKSLWIAAALLLWFGLPTLVQSLALWRDLRGAWLYALSGLVSAVVAYLVFLQFNWTYNSLSYATIIGAGVQAILTGAAFLTIMAQNQQAQAQEAVALPQEA
jgi:hypothetical protein